MNNYKKQFNKGVLELGIMKLLLDNDLYGYNIIQEIKSKSKELIEIKDGTLYPILYRLEDQKHIESYWNTPENGRGKPRKYYKITGNGKVKYTEMLDAYVEVNKGINYLLDS